MLPKEKNMNIEYVQELQHKLQKRIDKLNSFDSDKPILFHYLVKQYWFFLQSHPIFVSILDELSCRFSSIQNEIEPASHSYLIYDTEAENAAACYFTLRKLIALDDQMVISQSLTPYVDKDQFKFTFLTNLHEYIDEQLSYRRVTLALLNRYKHKCEWFKREKLFNLWSNSSNRGEKLLASHFYEYLHDQGLDFTIEPYSISGEVDLIFDQRGDERLIAEAKIFDGANRGKLYLSKGVRQVYQYLLDFNQSSGYLIIYKVCEKDLRLSLSYQLQFTPFIIHNHKTIFFLVVDLFSYDLPASQRGTLKSIEITEDDLIQILCEDSSDSDEEKIE
jgi:hypothetical protein